MFLFHFYKGLSFRYFFNSLFQSIHSLFDFQRMTYPLYFFVRISAPVMINKVFYLSRVFIVGIVDISVFISLQFPSFPGFSTNHIVTSFPQSSINLHKFMKIGSKMVQDWFKSSVAFHHYLLLYIISYLFLPFSQFLQSAISYLSLFFHKIALPSI